MSKQGLLGPCEEDSLKSKLTVDERHQHTLHYKTGILKQKTIEKEVQVRARNKEIITSMQKSDMTVQDEIHKQKSSLSETKSNALKLRDNEVPFRDEEIEITFDMSTTIIDQPPKLMTKTEKKQDETLEDTYASLGVTFLELTSQMQNALKEVTSTSEETFETTTQNNDKSNELPFIDETDAELDAAIEAAAPDLDYQDYVTSIQVCSDPCIEHFVFIKPLII
jgi:hypothetical protein